ncbi:MAG: polymerase sigma-54 factor RpoN [Mycobacterium sp.]|jgi:RNA polymerase sigma-70 factor (ECF subfamily)|nr:polymerase sigma-54 factor RpoN [Mycobacterium sp.]
MDGGDDTIASLIDAALSGDYTERARLLTYAATGRSADKAGFDELLDGIASRASAGSEPALELLLELVHGLHLADSAIRSRISDAALADDVAQQTLIAVESHIASYGGLAHFRTWLYAVARNESLMMLRRRLPEPKAEPQPPAVGRFTSIVANKMTIADVIRSLPEPYGETLSLQIFEDLDYEAIAGRLQIPVGTVRSRLAKGKELLRQALQNAPL